MHKIWNSSSPVGTDHRWDTRFYWCGFQHRLGISPRRQFDKSDEICKQEDNFLRWWHVDEAVSWALWKDRWHNIIFCHWLHWGVEIAVVVPRGYPRVNVTGMIEREQNSPRKITVASNETPKFPWPNINPPKISSPYSQSHITRRHWTFKQPQTGRTTWVA